MADQPVVLGRAIGALLAAAGSMTLTFYVLYVASMNSPFDTYTPGTSLTIPVIAVLLLGLAKRNSHARSVGECGRSARRRAGRLGHPGGRP